MAESLVWGVKNRVSAAIQIHKKFFGGYEVYVDMDRPGTEWSMSDVTFDIPEYLALQLTKGQLISFHGTIDSVHRFLGSCQVILKDVSVLPQ